MGTELHYHLRVHRNVRVRAEAYTKGEVGGG